MSKSFKTAPTPQRQPTSEQILEFVDRGEKAQAAAVGAGAKEPTARLSLELKSGKLLESGFQTEKNRTREY